MNSFENEIMDLLDGDTPRKKWQSLKDLISENNRAKGRIDFCKNQFMIIQSVDDSPYIRGVIEQLNTPI